MVFSSIFKTGISKIGKNILHYVNPFISRSAVTSGNIQTVDLAYSVCDKRGASKKPPLLIFHGLFGSKKDVDNLSKEINQATGIKVITFDARNHGDSPHSPQHSYFHMADDVIELLKKLELPKVSLLGHSIGGYTAMVLALMRPDLISSLAVEDISPVEVSERTIPIGKLFEAMSTLSISSDVSMAKARELAHEHLKSATNDVNVRNYLINELVNSNDSFYTFRFNVPVLKAAYLAKSFDFPANLKGFQYTGPTLFIAGSLSDFVRSSDLPEIRKYFPSAEITYIDGAGHSVHYQQPEKFLEILSKFLTED